MTPEPPAPARSLRECSLGDGYSLPDIIRRSGSNATFAANEFFHSKVSNDHTRRAYLPAVKLFLEWVETLKIGELNQSALAYR